jgi:NAD(P)-dependent dehydrogenase (short-subunit alcohol dehydrogenase family)
MNILITGTSSGIGSELYNKLSLNNNVISANRTIIESSGKKNDIHIDMSSQKSILDFVTKISKKNIKFDMIILNVGIKSTRKRVEWNGKQINLCRVVNLLANDYLLEQLSNHNLIYKKAKIVFMTSITHWFGLDNPNPENDLDDPQDANWANQQYPNTKFGLFILAKMIKKINPSFDVILINPGMVSTKIFGDKNENGFLSSSIRYVREWLSFTPEESTNYIVESIMSENTTTKEFRYFTPYQSLLVFGFSESTQMLQDVLGRRFLTRLNTDTDNFSNRVFDDLVEQNYITYLQK